MFFSHCRLAFIIATLLAGLFPMFFDFNNVFSPFIYMYTIVFTIAILKGEKTLGLEQLGASLLLSLFVACIIISIFAGIAFVLSLLLIGEFAFFTIIFKRLIILVALILLCYQLFKTVKSTNQN